MFKFGPTEFDPDFLSSFENFNSAEWFDVFASDDETVVPAVIVDNPLTGLSLNLDGDVLDGLFAEADATVGEDGADSGSQLTLGFESGNSHEDPDFGFTAASDVDTGAPVVLPPYN